MSSLEKLLSPRTMPTGRHAFSLAEMHRRAAAENLPDLAARIQRASDHAKYTLKLEMLWNKTRTMTSIARGDAVAVDRVVDAQVAAIEAIVRGAKVGDDNEPNVKLARELHKEVFPAGVGAITRKAFEIELGLVDAMIDRFVTDLSHHVTELGLERHVERLTRLADEYRTELLFEEMGKIEFKVVEDARKLLHAYTQKAVVAAFYVLDSDDAATQEKLAHILAPLADQQARVFALNSAKRKAKDVNARTGKENENEDEDETENQNETPVIPATE